MHEVGFRDHIYQSVGSKSETCFRRRGIYQNVGGFEGSQSRQTIKLGNGSRGTRNQELLCWREPAAI
jgi:hypothetical protein